MKKISKKNYIDGGLFDNLPINSAIDMGATDIIAVNLNAPGIVERVKNKDIPITYIEPTSDIGWFLDFNEKNANHAIRIGYLDTLKVYNELDGNKYTFKKNSFYKLHKAYGKILLNRLEYIFDYKENKKALDEILTLAAFKRLVSMKKDNQLIVDDILEYIMDVFDFNLEEIYSLGFLNFKLLYKLHKCSKVNKNNIDKISNKEKLLNINNKKSIIKYFYINIDLCYKDASKKKDICKLSLIYPKEFLCALYLYSVRKKMLFW